MLWLPRYFVLLFCFIPTIYINCMVNNNNVDTFSDDDDAQIIRDKFETYLIRKMGRLVRNDLAQKQQEPKPYSQQNINKLQPPNYGDKFEPDEQKYLYELYFLATKQSLLDLYRSNQRSIPLQQELVQQVKQLADQQFIDDGFSEKNIVIFKKN
ncbi:unnamed protein product [Didymodactylos carnosus]|uniref:Uncharacterized protein n=1 Tax=Didymodactylos carnosus TaxID=1234261 RepID=A0A814SBS6_9BILA|nr:unnamed protein product [Didymodactylos carnosus]CAF1142944.1 unnamed protein product [Didymodactylos carnosus]CAF3803269.1 unnamed protein product [Didymodactylos carnosus]CAF3906566.1 unnamed protein product [Didymodactylos carnosus]